jgi:pimeloyl-ACP methyl ester carboxylesterase
VGPKGYADVAANGPTLELPVVVAPGWGETPRVFAKAIAILAASGRRTICVKHPRWGGGYERWAGAQPAEVRKAKNILATMDACGVQKADAIAHSEGAINILLAAHEAPDRFRTIILVGPAGLLKKDRLLPLMLRLLWKVLLSIVTAIRRPEQRRAILVGLKEGNLYLLANPVRGVREGMAIATARMGSLIRPLRKWHGVKIIVVSGVDDPLFAMQRLQQLDCKLDGFVSVRGVHDELYFQPERYVPAITSLLATLGQPD